MKITCDDAPRLENSLHKEFHHRRRNKVNLRKEFFEVSISEVAEAVERLHGKVEYTADAEALDYRNSLIATDADLAEIEEVFAQNVEDADDELPTPVKSTPTLALPKPLPPKSAPVIVAKSDGCPSCRRVVKGSHGQRYCVICDVTH